MPNRKTRPLNQSGAQKNGDATVKIPLVREDVDVSKKIVETGIVRIRKIVREHEEVIDQALLCEQVEVTRVSINRVIDEPVATRYEGELLIVPVLEERVLIQKQWVLKEELHISRRSVTMHQPQRIVVRSEEAIVEHERLNESDA